MRDERIFYVEWRYFRSTRTDARVTTARHITEVLDELTRDPDVIFFSVEDITHQNIVDFDERMSYNGAYSL